MEFDGSFASEVALEVANVISPLIFRHVIALRYSYIHVFFCLHKFYQMLEFHDKVTLLEYTTKCVVDITSNI